MVSNDNDARKTTGLALRQDDGSMREIYEDDLDEKSRPVATKLAQLLGRRDRKQESYNQSLDIVADYEDLVALINKVRMDLNNLLPAQANIKVASAFKKPNAKSRE
tara:strand:- start:714 stop:1031 length:318 start_codon:yes stop_codon:yes gene_type:complete